MVAVLHRRRKLILQVFLAGVATVAIGVWLHGPSYIATATLMVRSDRARVAMSPDETTRPTVERISDQDMNAEIALLRSKSLMREVLEPYYDPNYDGSTWFDTFMSVLTFPIEIPSILYRWLHGIPQQSLLDRWSDGAASSLWVETIGKSNLISVSYEDGNPEWAAKLVNAVVAKHIERRSEMSRQSEARRFYESQREILTERARQAENALQAFYQRVGMDSMTPDERAGFRTHLTELEQTLAKSETELREGEARVEFLTREITNYPKNISTEARVAQNQQLIKPRILELQMQRSELLSRYAPTSVKIKDINRQIEEAKQLLANEREVVSESTSAINPAYQALEVDLAQTRAQVAALNARVDAMRTQVQESRAKVERLDAIQSEQEQLETDLTNAKAAISVYTKKEEEARFTSALDASNLIDVAIADPARVPTAPAKTKAVMIMLFGSVMSLMAGVAIAFVRDRLDPAVQSAAQARRTTGLPVIAEVAS
jgi:uncharacterized protein involved in exopolysaccharide biosynthesis